MARRWSEREKTRSKDLLIVRIVSQVRAAVYSAAVLRLRDQSRSVAVRQ